MRNLIASLFVVIAGLIFVSTCGICAAAEGDGDVHYNYYLSDREFYEGIDTIGDLWGGAVHAIVFHTIEDYDMVYWLQANNLGSGGSSWAWETEELMSVQADFDGYIGEDYICSGRIVVNLPFRSACLYFDDFDRGEYTGTQTVVLTYSNDLDGWMINGTNVGGNTAGSVDCPVMLLNTATPRYLYANYYLSWGTVWHAKMSWTTMDYNSTLVNISRTIDGTAYPATWIVKTDLEGSLYSEYHVEKNVDFISFDRPITTACKDTLDMWHNKTLYPDWVGASRLYGYVFDAKYHTLVSDVDVWLDNTPYTTGGTGFYVFNDVDGNYTLNASLTGYQNYSVPVYIPDWSMRHDIPLMPNETAYAGTCTVAGVVRDIETKAVIENSRVSVYNDTFSTYMYANELGYFVFYNLTNTSYTLKATHSDYVNAQENITLANLDVCYYYVLELLDESTMEPEPTATPDPDEEDETPVVTGITTIFDLFGLGEYMGYIFAFALIAVMGLGFGSVAHGNSLAIAIGSFFGFVIDVAIGWLPVWLLAVVICVTVFFIVKTVGR